jgi:hypothetical protein
MRKNALHIVMAVFGLLGFLAVSASAASSKTNAMTVRFSLTASVQAPTETVSNATSTNVTYKVNKFRFTHNDMLTVLASEFGATFPDGAQLGVQLGEGLQFVVLDKTGNIFLNVSTNSDASYVFNITNSSSAVQWGKTSVVPNKATEVISEMQPDFTVYYADGKGNHFHFGGLVTFRANVLVEGGTTTFKTVSMTISGSGAGTLFNHDDGKYETVVLTGPWMATAVNIP